MRSDARLPGWTSCLLAEAALTSAGGQFREVALPLLVFALWPSPRSYALALALLLLPRVALAGLFAGLGDGPWPRRVVVASYGLRALAVLLLIEARGLGLALGALLLLAVGVGAYGPAVAPYHAAVGVTRLPALLGRLRVVAALAQALVPVAAGALIATRGRETGFMVALAAYLVAGLLMFGLPPRPPGTQLPGDRPVALPTPVRALPSAIRREVLVLAMLSALGWAANALYAAYLVVDLRAGALRYGIALALWGGSGILAGARLGRVPRATLARLSGLGLGALALAWAAMSRPLGYLPVALLGVPEGFVTWLLLDLLQVRVPERAGARERGAFAAAAARWAAGGRLVGLAAVLAVPVFG